MELVCMWLGRALGCLCLAVLVGMAAAGEELFSERGARPVRVLLSLDRETVTFEHPGGIDLLDEEGRLLLAGNPLAIRPSGSGFSVGRRLLRGDLLLVRPRQRASPTLVNGKRSYRGSFVFRKSSTRPLLINVVPMEAYVAAVVGGEVPFWWPAESLKAQAVVARTYAARKMSERTHKLYDLVDTVEDQVYPGVAGEQGSTGQAAAETRGEVLHHRGEIITAYYHADCGGRTEVGSRIFPGELPYLQSVVCPFRTGSPYQEWRKTVTATELRHLLEGAGHAISREIEEVQVLANPESGRIEGVRVRHGGGVVEIPGKEFRRLIGRREMRSTLARLSVTRERSVGSPPPASAPPRQPAVAMDETIAVEEVSKESWRRETAPLSQRSPIMFVYGTGSLTLRPAGDPRPLLVIGEGGKWIRRREFQTVSLSSRITMVPSPPSPAKRLSSIPRPSSPPPKPEPARRRIPAVFMISGNGWGHGVGLCQWGAKGMAEQGYTYRQILGYYYKEVELHKEVSRR